MKYLTNDQVLRIFNKDNLLIDQALDSPVCTHTGAKIGYLRVSPDSHEGNWILYGYSKSGEDIDLRHWN